MHNFLIAMFFIAIVLSPCLAALWTSELFVETRKNVNAAPRATPTAAATGAAMEAAPLVEAAGPKPTREGLLRCARSSQLRRFHVHQAGSAGESKLRSLRPVA